MRSGARRAHVVVMVLFTTLATTVSMVPAATAAPPADPGRTHPQVEPLSWTPCGDGFSCATHEVPLDYDHPNGRTITLALNKLPATDPSRRIGSLFVNPGGPGGSGVDFVRDLGARLFTPEVRARFDIVGFDPRGVMRSSPLRCFDTVEEAAEAALLPFPYPNSREKRRAWIAADRRLSEACERRGGPILDHMSTADVARDLDRLRQAVGDDQLTYYGVSYGSFLGTTYANLFPGRFRALVVDGVLDPIAWTTGRGNEGRRVPVNLRVGAAVGPPETVAEFFRLCDAGGPRCAFAPHSAQRHAALYRALRREPLLLPQADGTTVTYDESFLVADTLFAMFDPDTWPDLAATLAELEKGVNPTRVSAKLRSLRQGFATTEDYQNFFEGYPGVLCSESTNPTEYRAWDREVRRSLRRDGIYGPLPAWFASVCARWPGRAADRYVGPFTRRTAERVLVVGNRFDPATPYRGAVLVDRLLPRSSLLTVEAWGHTSLFASSCADDVIARYLLTSAAPARGTTCRADVTPFAEPTSATARARTTPTLPIPGLRPYW